MKVIEKSNRTEILGKTFFLADEISLTAKLNYIDGIDYFNDILKNTSIKEIGAVIHLYKRKNGLEIRLTKLFKYFSVGIQYDEISDISFIKETEHSFLSIKLKNNKSLLFTFNIENKKDIVDFFNKIKIQTHEIANKLNLENELLKIRTFNQRLMGNKEFLYIQLFMLSIGIAIGLISFVVSIILNKPLTGFYTNPFLLYGSALIGQIVYITNSSYRLRDLNLNMYYILIIVSPALFTILSLIISKAYNTNENYNIIVILNIINILAIVLSIINLFCLVYFSIKKGIIYKKLGKEILI